MKVILFIVLLSAFSFAQGYSVKVEARSPNLVGGMGGKGCLVYTITVGKEPVKIPYKWIYEPTSHLFLSKGRQSIGNLPGERLNDSARNSFLTLAANTRTIIIGPLPNSIAFADALDGAYLIRHYEFKTATNVLLKKGVVQIEAADK